MSVAQKNIPVTVLIPTYNRAHYIAQSLESILEQHLAPVQIIVVDDGSSDDTARVLAPYRDRIEYCRKSHGGKASAVNHALDKVRGTFLWVFDDDDIALPTALESHAKGFHENGDIGFTYSSFYNGQDGRGDGLRIISEHRAPALSPDQVFVELLFGNFTGGHPAVVVRTDCYRKLGGLDEGLLRSQDYEFTLRLSRHYAGAAVDEFTFVRRLHREGSWGKGEIGNRRAPSEWKKYDQIIIEKLYEELTELDYVPERLSTNRLSPNEKRLYRLRRAAMSARSELWDFFLRDIEAFVHLFLSGGSDMLSSEETRLIRLAMTARHGRIAELTGGRVAILKQILESPACAEIRANFLRGIRKTVLTNLRRRHLRETTRTAAIFARLL